VNQKNHSLIDADIGRIGELRRAVQVLQFTDLHLVSETQKELWGVNTYQNFIAALAYGMDFYSNADLLLITGDLVHEPEAASYRLLYEWLSTLELPVYRLPGNHDDMSMMKTFLNGANIRHENSLLAGEWQIILLDSNAPADSGGRLHESELKRLKQTLSDHPDRYALVCLHHHPVPIQSSWMDAMALNNPGELFSVLDAHSQVRGVVWGHIHQEFEARRGDVCLLGAPATSIQFVPHCDRFQRDKLGPGLRWLSLHPDGRIETRVHYLPVAP
jgi:Icc protein